MVLIDADKLYSERPEFLNPNHEKNGEFNKGWNACINTFCDTIKEQPTVAGHCKDCKSADFYPNSDFLYCLEHSCVMEADGFCNRFQREV